MASQEPTGDLGRRALASASWNLLSSLARIAVLLVRSVLLARWLPVATFGVYGLCQSLILFTGIVASFGLFAAYLHRCPETEDEETATAAYFTLSTLLTLLWVAVLVGAVLALASGEHRTALLVLIPAIAVNRLTAAPRAILIRRVRHARLAVLELTHASVGSAVAIGLAWRGATLWALLSVDITLAALAVLFLWLWRPVWRPRVRWASSQVRYFLRFGATKVVADTLFASLSRLDRLWTGFILGDVQLGLYSRAMAFASYPQRILAQPLDLVVGGSFAELKRDRRRLSETFFRANALLLRGGFLLAGLLALTAPELITLLIGDRWLPMLPVFRLMLLYTLLDPIKATIAHLFVAVGRPDRLVRARVAQVLTLVAGLLTLGTVLGIRGVALTVNVMQAVGITMLLLQARRYVRFSVTRLFAAPLAALAAGLSLALAGAAVLTGGSSALLSGSVKAFVFVAVYGLVLISLEWRSLQQMVSLALESWQGRSGVGRIEAPPSGLPRGDTEGADEEIP